MHNADFLFGVIGSYMWDAVVAVVSLLQSGSHHLAFFDLISPLSPHFLSELPPDGLCTSALPVLHVCD